MSKSVDNETGANPKPQRLRFKDITWTSSNRHTTIVNTDYLPFDISDRDLREASHCKKKYQSRNTK